MADDNQKQAGSMEKEAGEMSSVGDQNLSTDGQNIKNSNNINNLDLAAKSSDVGEDRNDCKENDPDDENESKTDKSSIPFYKVSKCVF